MRDNSALVTNEREARDLLNEKWTFEVSPRFDDKANGVTAIGTRHVTFYQNTFSSRYDLLLTIHHEYIHVSHILSGKLDDWYYKGYKRTNGDIIKTNDYVRGLTEYWAYKSGANYVGYGRYDIDYNWFTNQANKFKLQAQTACPNCFK